MVFWPWLILAFAAGWLLSGRVWTSIVIGWLILKILLVWHGRKGLSGILHSWMVVGHSESPDDDIQYAIDEVGYYADTIILSRPALSNRLKRR